MFYLRQSSSLSLNMFQARRYYHWPISNNIEDAITNAKKELSDTNITILAE